MSGNGESEMTDGGVAAGAAADEPGVQKAEEMMRAAVQAAIGPMVTKIAELEARLAGPETASSGMQQVGSAAAGMRVPASGYPPGHGGAARRGAAEDLIAQAVKALAAGVVREEKVAAKAGGQGGGR